MQAARDDDFRGCALKLATDVKNLRSLRLSRREMSRVLQKRLAEAPIDYATAWRE